MQPVRLALPFLAVALLPARPAPAVEFSGTATTIVRAYDLMHVELLDQNTVVQRVISYRPVDQNVQLSWDEVGKRKAWSFDVSLRGRTDMNSGKGDPGIGGSWQGSDLDVLVANARWRSKQGLVGLTIGRQNAITSYGWHAYDGVRLDFAKLKHLRVFVDAGLPVDLFDGGSPNTDGFTWATGVTGVFPKYGSIGADYEVRTEGGDTLSEAAGFDAELHYKNFRFAADGNYSLLLEEFGETSAMVGGTVSKRHDLELRFTRVRPIFDSDSIFNAWDVNPYDETRLQYEYRAKGPLDIGAYVSFEDYVPPDLGLDEGPPPTPEDPSDLPEDIKRAAVTGRWETGHHGIHRSEIGWQDGWTGGRLALMHDSDWGLTPRWNVGGGASMHRYENRYRLVNSDEVWSMRARVKYDRDSKWSLALEVEQFFGRDRDTMRAMLVFDTRFGKARHSFPWWGGNWNWSRATGANGQREPRVKEAQ